MAAPPAGNPDRPEGPDPEGPEAQPASGDGTGPSPLPSVGSAGRAARISWYLYDLANQMFPFLILSFVFNPWLVEVLGARDAAYLVTFSGSMLAALLLAPLLGAVTDRLGRRPFLIATTLVAVTAIAMLGIGQALGLGRTATLTLALGWFAIANLAFQLGVVVYDSFLPAVSSHQRLGRTGGLGISVGYLGSFVALALMALVTGVLGWTEPALFAAAGALFLLLALPAFQWLRDAPRTGSRPLFRSEVGAAWQDVLATLRGLRRDRVMARFLITRLCYADAIMTLILVMGVYAIHEMDFVRDSTGYFVLLGLGILFAVLAAPLWGMVVDRIGPRHTLQLVLAGWCFTLAMVIVLPVLGLPQHLFYAVGALVGVFLAGTWTSDRPLLVGMAPPDKVGQWFGLYALAGRFAAITGPLTWALAVDLVFRDHPGARQFGVLTILATMALALYLLRRLPDPFRPGPSPLQTVKPWGDGSGRRLEKTPPQHDSHHREHTAHQHDARPLEHAPRQHDPDSLDRDPRQGPDRRPPRPWRLLRFAPFVPAYLVFNWIVFFAMSPRPHPRNILVVDHAALQGYPVVDRLYYWLPDLVEAPWRLIPASLTAPLVNVHLVQLLYVTVLLLLFGWIFEVREGPRRTVLVFFAASILGSLFASILHAVLYPGLLDHPILEQARNMLWTGGSAGAFGLLGAVAARARNPWPLLALFLLWELNVGLWYLQSYTPAFHVSALAVGFLLTRYALRVPPVPASPEGPLSTDGR